MGYGLKVSAYAPEGDDAFGAGRPFLGVPELGRASFTGCELKCNTPAACVNGLLG